MLTVFHMVHDADDTVQYLDTFRLPTLHCSDIKQFPAPKTSCNKMTSHRIQDIAEKTLATSSTSLFLKLGNLKQHKGFGKVSLHGRDQVYDDVTLISAHLATLEACARCATAAGRLLTAANPVAAGASPVPATVAAAAAAVTARTAAIAAIALPVRAIS